ncbi:MAG TPA: sigma-70 family RNA polymerase sigma factor [Symbiobacteriaceae bacterium]|nr:sigma-70 family RNA polymerase sigma factor [Symbiobacteriaceae bacterium]
METLEDLVVHHQEPLFAFLYRMCGETNLAEELMQETFVRAFEAAKRYRPEAAIRTWLFSIAANLVRDRWRRRARRGEDLPLDDLVIASPATAEEDALRLISYEAVRSALPLLPVEQRTALILRYYHDLSYDEIAHVLACPIGTVRSRIHNGLARLKRLLVSNEVIAP